MKVVFCSSEVVPFAKTGGLADVAGALPQAIKQLGHEVIIIMPGYSCIKQAKIPIKKINRYFSYAKYKGVTFYFTENKNYFNRDGLYGDKKGDYKDNLLRFSYYCKRTIELLKEINFQPDIIHCNDWQTALIPVYLKTKYRNESIFERTKSILTIHNLAYQGLFDQEQFSGLDLDNSLFSFDGFEFYGKTNLLKAGILFSDCVATVSDGYAREILAKEFGCGLEGVLKKRKNELYGIINGLDYSLWDPKKDRLIFRPYDRNNLSAKIYNKKELQKLCGLPIKEDACLLGFVGRLAEQKGINLLAEIMPDIKDSNVQIVVLGTGEEKYHKLLDGVAKKYPKFLSLYLKFDNVLAHRIYAGADMFLMPSRYEPCGLGQMISFKYGTIPIACNTGGLRDTVVDFNSNHSKGNGFVFDKFSKQEFLSTINRARSVFSNKKNWNNLIKHVMSLSFSWQDSAKSYIKLYKKI